MLTHECFTGVRVIGFQLTSDEQFIVLGPFPPGVVIDAVRVNSTIVMDGAGTLDVEIRPVSSPRILDQSEFDSSGPPLVLSQGYSAGTIQCARDVESLLRIRHKVDESNRFLCVHVNAASDTLHGFVAVE
jgi:hypothetical protein